MEIETLNWVPVNSKADIALTVGAISTAEMSMEDANSWGYFEVPTSRRLVVGYRDFGLIPVAAIADQLLVGIDGVLAGFELEKLRMSFRYEMPTIFHEFISISSSIIARDEVGFVCLDSKGQKRWELFTSGPISEFEIRDGMIRGITIDDKPFELMVPR